MNNDVIVKIVVANPVNILFLKFSTTVRRSMAPKEEWNSDSPSNAYDCKIGAGDCCKIRNVL